jgi:hypothetical protein
MKWAGMYLIGFACLLAGVMLALWKIGVLAIVGSFWTGVIVLALIGIGIMVSAISSNQRRVEIDRI